MNWEVPAVPSIFWNWNWTKFHFKRNFYNPAVTCIWGDGSSRPSCMCWRAYKTIMCDHHWSCIDILVIWLFSLKPSGDRGEHRPGLHGQVLPAAVPPLPHADAPLGRVRPLRARPPALPRGPRHPQLQQEDDQGMDLSVKFVSFEIGFGCCWTEKQFIFRFQFCKDFIKYLYLQLIPI